MYIYTYIYIHYIISLLYSRPEPSIPQLCPPDFDQAIL